MKYETLLFDVDNTILDFNLAEDKALEWAFAQLGMHFDNKVLEVYRRNNIAEWQRLERGETTVEEVLKNRFVYTFRELGLAETNIDKVAVLYEQRLHFGYYTIPHASEVLEKLQKVCRLYVVTNGVLSIQNSRMKGSGMGKYFIKRFISEEIGCPKPNKEFFDRSFAQIENLDKSRALIIGDSLSSDIQGGVNAGVDTCWFNPKGEPNNSKLLPNYEISDLRELYKIVGV